MNEKFFALPKEKQQRIINAGYRVFSRNSYRKSPVGGIAAEADISKSKEYPDLTGFVMKAFYEKEPEIAAAIQESYQKFFGIKAAVSLSRLKTEDLREGVDVNMMFQEMYRASEGIFGRKCRKAHWILRSWKGILGSFWNSGRRYTAGREKYE